MTDSRGSLVLVSMSYVQVLWIVVKRCVALVKCRGSWIFDKTSRVVGKMSWVAPDMS